MLPNKPFTTLTLFSLPLPFLATYFILSFANVHLLVIFFKSFFISNALFYNFFSCTGLDLFSKVSNKVVVSCDATLAEPISFISSFL